MANDRTEQPSAGIPPIELLRPTWAKMARHCFIYLARCAFYTTIAAIFVVQPVYFAFLRAYGAFFFGSRGDREDCVSMITRTVHSSPFHQALLMTVVFTLCCHALPWCFFNGIFTFLDSFHPESPLLNGFARHHPDNPLVRRIQAFVIRHKMPRSKNQWPSKELVAKTVRGAAVDLFIVIPAAVFCFVYVVGHRNMPLPNAIPGFEEGRAHTPWSFLCAFAKIFPHYVVANLINEVGFFLVHGLVHYSSHLYIWIHKQHHEYTGTISMAAEYANAVEAIFANTIPTIIYFTYAFFAASELNEAVSATGGAGDQRGSFHSYRRCWPLFITWMWARLFETYETHSGYYLYNTFRLNKYLGFFHGKRARFHDFHHTHNRGNYGAGIIMDAVCNTMDPFLRHKYLEEHEKGIHMKWD